MQAVKLFLDSSCCACGTLIRGFQHICSRAGQGALSDSAAHLPDAAWKPTLHRAPPAVCPSEKEASSLFLGHPLRTHARSRHFGTEAISPPINLLCQTGCVTDAHYSTCHHTGLKCDCRVFTCAVGELMGFAWHVV